MSGAAQGAGRRAGHVAGTLASRSDGGLAPAFVAELRAALLEFYDAGARDLPWRRTSDPYAVWVAEVMAQQTRVDTVIPYYERWLRRFPDIDTLADAPLDVVYREWEGLGYYSRARNLHAASRLVRERHAGRLPGTYAQLRELPGVGDYTAGAVSSIAFGERQPAVDGNVRRVLARLLDEPEPSPAWLRSHAAALVPDDRPGDFNQSLMELGATVCTPSSPLCDACPINALCAARAAGTQAERPRRSTGRRMPTFDIATAVIHTPDGRVLVTRRPAHGLLAGMWSFPGRELDDGAGAADAAAALASALCAPTPQVQLGSPVAIGVVEHVFSHRRERYVCYAIAASSAQAWDGDRTWIGSGPRDVALPKAQQRIHALALAALENGQR
jgi:A/G-specific adenine glycosylase